MSRCLRQGREAWYALAHLVGPEGDVVFGRETFGYPSRSAAIDWRRAGRSFELTATRLGRTVVTLAGNDIAAGDSTGSAARPGAGGGARAESASEQAPVVGLRLHPAYRAMTEHGFREPGPRADLVAQPWAIAWSSRRAVDPAGLSARFPDAPGPGRIGRPDPWYELAPGALVAVAVGRGVVRRGPGETLGALADWSRFYLERFDGAMTAGEATSGRASHTFLVG